MATSYTKNQVQRRINKIFKDVKAIKIKEHNSNHISVNSISIKQYEGYWNVDNDKNSFALKKSAVGYVICNETKNAPRAKQIKLLDRKISKLKEDVWWYHHGLKRSNNKDLYYARLDDVMPKLTAARNQLYQTLKIVKIT
jgi:hypothetical protein